MPSSSPAHRPTQIDILQALPIILHIGCKQIMFAKEVIDQFYGPKCSASVMYDNTDSTLRGI